MSRVTISPDTVHQELAGEAVLLHLGSETYFSLDEVGTRIWQLLERHTDMEAVVSQMLGEYQVEEAVLRADIGRIVRELTEAGLLRLEADEPR